MYEGSTDDSWNIDGRMARESEGFLMLKKSRPNFFVGGWKIDHEETSNDWDRSAVVHVQFAHRHTVIGFS